MVVVRNRFNVCGCQLVSLIWRLETKMNLTMVKYTAKIEGKKQQLMSVQLSRRYAQPLEVSSDLCSASATVDSYSENPNFRL
eukprot:2513081-Amphidinium_carterae.1